MNIFKLKKNVPTDRLQPLIIAVFIIIIAFIDT